MKPPDFSYHAPSRLEEAVEMAATLDNAKLLAGGQSLMAMLNMRFVQPDHLIDLNGVEELTGITRAGREIRIGAMTRQREIEHDIGIAADLPLLREAILQVGHRQTRNRGTLGGSLCHLDPAAELVSVAAAHDARVEIAGARGRREIGFADFAQGFMTPAIGPDEIVVAVRFALWARPHGFAFVELARRQGDFAIVSAAALIEQSAEGRIVRVSLTIGGAGPTPTRMRDAEVLLVGERGTPELFRAAGERCRQIEAMEDAHASAPYRRHLAAVLSRRALVAAHARASGSTATDRGVAS